MTTEHKNTGRTVEITNKGARVIRYSKDGFLRPGKKVAFPSDLAQKLLRLYPDELTSGTEKAEPYVPDSSACEKKG